MKFIGIAVFVHTVQFNIDLVAQGLHHHRHHGNIVCLMAQWGNFTCDLAADGLHLGVQPIAHHIDALFAVIVNQIQRLHRVIQLAGVQAKRFDHILHIDLLGAIDFLGKIVAGAQGQQHHRGLCMRQAVGNLMYCAVAATADNDTAIAILCRISRCNLSGVAGMVRLFHNHLIIKKTKSGADTVENSLFVLMTGHRIHNKYILHLFFPSFTPGAVKPGRHRPPGALAAHGRCPRRTRPPARYGTAPADRLVQRPEWYRQSRRRARDKRHDHPAADGQRQAQPLIRGVLGGKYILIIHKGGAAGGIDVCQKAIKISLL